MHNRELKRSFKGVDGTTMKILMFVAVEGQRTRARQRDRALDDPGRRRLDHRDRSAARPQGRSSRDGAPASDDLREALRAYEKAHIHSVLLKVEQDKKAAAELLGVSLSSLYAQDRRAFDLAGC